MSLGVVWKTPTMAAEQDWVRVVERERCVECELAAATITRAELAPELRRGASAWASLLQAVPAERLRARPARTRWSALEYGGHVRGVLEVFAQRVDRMANEVDPDLGWWDHEGAVADQQYQAAVPAELASGIVDAADGLADRLDRLDAAGWSRHGRRRPDEHFTVEGLARFALHEVVHHLHDAATLVGLAWAGDGRAPTTAAATRLLRTAPTTPSDLSAFTSNPLFGQPGIYPTGPPMVPADGPPLDDLGAEQLLEELLEPDLAAVARRRYRSVDLRERVPEPVVRTALLLLGGGPADPELTAFLDGDTPVRRLGLGPTTGAGRVVGPERDDDTADRRVVDERYAREHPAVIAPSLAHALCHHGDLASTAEEATLHGLLAAVHTWLLAGHPELATLRSELARRQSSLTITLLNARPPGMDTASVCCPDGPGTIPGGDPALQCPDLWSIPFTDRDPARCDLFVPRPVRDSLARLAAGTAPPVPDRYDDTLGSWLRDHLGRGAWFGPVVRATAGLALGLFDGGAPVDGPGSDDQSA